MQVTEKKGRKIPKKYLIKAYKHNLLTGQQDEYVHKVGGHLDFCDEFKIIELCTTTKDYYKTYDSAHNAMEKIKRADKVFNNDRRGGWYKFYSIIEFDEKSGSIQELNKPCIEYEIKQAWKDYTERWEWRK